MFCNMITTKPCSLRKLFSFSRSSILYSLVLMGPVWLLVGCEQSTPEARTEPATSTEKTEQMIYRPKVKLTTTDSDPSVLKKFLQARKHIYQEEYESARKQLLPLAEAGYTDAQLAMAHSYMPHEITNPPENTQYDWEQGIPWLILSADGNNARAQWLLGDWYYHGYPGRVKRDYYATEWDKVNYYLLAAAEQGLASAQSELATLYASAHGVEMNEQALRAYGDIHKVKAYMWYTLASQRYAKHDGIGIDRKGLELRLRDRLLDNKGYSQMTKERVTEGERMVKEWTRTHPDAYRVETPPELYPSYISKP